jgi:hypothetical protein
MNAAQTISLAPADAKRLATAKARAALAGVELHAIESDDGRPQYICTKWAMTASFADMAQVEAWLSRVDGKPA